MRPDLGFLYLVFGIVLLTVPTAAQDPDLNGVRLALDQYDGPAKVFGKIDGPFRLRIEVERNGERKKLGLRVKLPVTGRKAWPAADVVVLDAMGKALMVQRPGIEWENLLIPLDPGATSCVIEAVEPRDGWPVLTSHKERKCLDPQSGAQVRIAPWPNGHRAALSIRFDDSHPTHLSKAIPILREYGFRGTFMVNPGPKEPGSRKNYPFETQYADWLAVMKQGDQELANHSAHHRGATNDTEMESEIATAARAIWELMPPGRSRLTALNLGGGTLWKTSRPLRYYLKKFNHFDASSGSLGMDDVYGGRVEAFRKMLEHHLERGLWCRIHYHYIGKNLSSSEANFRAALDIARMHQDDLWIAGMADIYKYQTARNAASLRLDESKKQGFSFRLHCATDPVLYDQPLTVEIDLPKSWDPEKLRITSAADREPKAIIPSKGKDASILRIQIPPKDETYSVIIAP